MIKKVIAFSIILSMFLLPVGAIKAASVDVLDDVCRGRPEATACKDRVGNSAQDAQNPIYGPNGIITKVVNVLSIIVGIAAVISIIFAGVRFITSGSNPQEVTKAREYIIYALIGLVVVAFAQILVRYVLDNVL